MATRGVGDCAAMARRVPQPTTLSGRWPSVADVPRSGGGATFGAGKTLPKITIITPSYNQGQYIEDTIRSVLLQGYPNVEYMIMDGGSTDGTLDVIKKYEPWITYWESGPDGGQAHAINKGLDKATGDICTYVNSDDYYLPNALWYVARTFLEQDWDLCLGNRQGSLFSARMLLRRSEWKQWLKPLGAPFLVGSSEYAISQESSFWSARCAAGHRFDEDLHYMLDVDWFSRIASSARVLRTSKELGVYRPQPASKTAFLGDRRPPVEFDLVADRWHLDPDARRRAVNIARSFARATPISVLKHYVLGHAEFSYTHPPCQETPLESHA